MANAAGRLTAAAELNDAVAAWCRGVPAAAGEAFLQLNAVPAVRARGIHDLASDAHLVVERGAFRQLSDASWTTTLPWMDADGWRGEFTPTPALGADNGYVLGDILQLPAELQEQLKARGVIR